MPASESRQRLRAAFIVTGKPAKTCRPPKRALNNPASRQQNKATLGLGEYDYFQLNAMLGCLLCGGLASIALIHIGKLYFCARDFLDFLNELATCARS